MVFCAKFAVLQDGIVDVPSQLICPICLAPTSLPAAGESLQSGDFSSAVTSSWKGICWCYRIGTNSLQNVPSLLLLISSMLYAAVLPKGTKLLGLSFLLLTRVRALGCGQTWGSGKYSKKGFPLCSSDFVAVLPPWCLHLSLCCLHLSLCCWVPWPLFARRALFVKHHGYSIWIR